MDVEGVTVGGRGLRPPCGLGRWWASACGLVVLPMAVLLAVLLTVLLTAPLCSAASLVPAARLVPRAPVAAGTPLGPQRATEEDVKAAYLFNFGKFMRLPEAAGAKRSTFDICLLGRDEFDGTLERLTANEKNNGLPERVVRVASAEEARSCAIVFVSRSEEDRLNAELAELAGRPVLTVSDMPHFLERGGMIELETQENHVRFSVSLDAVNRSGLALSSELLKVASKVTGTPKRETP